MSGWECYKSKEKDCFRGLRGEGGKMVAWTGCGCGGNSVQERVNKKDSQVCS